MKINREEPQPKYLNDTNGERQTPVIPQSISELMSGGLDVKLHMV